MTRGCNVDEEQDVVKLKDVKVWRREIDIWLVESDTRGTASLRKDTRCLSERRHLLHATLSEGKNITLHSYNSISLKCVNNWRHRR